MSKSGVEDGDVGGFSMMSSKTFEEITGARVLADYLERIVDTATATSDRDFGLAVNDVRDGLAQVYHASDDPERIVRLVRKKQEFFQTYGEKGRTAEKGPGLYASGFPCYWLGRSGQYLKPFARVTTEQALAMLDVAAREVTRDRANRRITEGEHNYAIRTVESAREEPLGEFGIERVVTLLRGMPYGIRLDRPEFLEEAGLPIPGLPATVEMWIKGRYGEVKRDNVPHPVLRLLRRMGLSGLFSPSGMGTQNEIVIWHGRDIVEAHVVRVRC